MKKGEILLDNVRKVIPYATDISSDVYGVLRAMYQGFESLGYVCTFEVDQLAFDLLGKVSSTQIRARLEQLEQKG